MVIWWSYGAVTKNRPAPLLLVVTQRPALVLIRLVCVLEQGEIGIPDIECNSVLLITDDN